MVVAVAEDARLVRLTVDDVIDHDSQVVIRLVPPIPVPEPFAAMLTELAANRANTNTAANPRAWGCFPTDAPASPRPWHVRPAVPRARVAATQARAAAFRQLVLDAPAWSSRAYPRLPSGNRHLYVIGTDRTWHRDRPPAPGAERGTEAARQHAGSGSLSRLSRRTWNDRPQGTLRMRQLT